MIAKYETYSARQGDELVSLHLPLVKRIANHLAVKLPPQIEIDDLVQVGLIGLLKAKEDYQPDSGATFSTYATIRIRGAMMDELRVVTAVMAPAHMRSIEYPGTVYGIPASSEAVRPIVMP